MRRPQPSPDSIAARANALAPQFDCSWTDAGLNAACVHLAGELDIDTTPQLEQTLRERDARARLVVLDMRDLAFMDGCGVHAIVDASARARKRGRRLAILRGPPEVDRVFALTGNAVYVDDGKIDPVDPSVQASVRRAQTDGAS